MKEYMKSVWTIVKREVAAQFGTPMAYIFIVVFVLISSVLYMFLPPFFIFPTADMSGFFGWVVPMLCIFAPAATMRVWAEDRKENTIELLLTFPMPSSALVLGKFVSALAFYLVAVAGTVMVPIMLASLGEPDWGMVFGGYLGMLLLGAYFIALGMFVSGFLKDQVTAFVLSFLACGASALFGWDPFVNILTGTLGDFGSFLSNALGMTGHYTPFTRGIIEFADILYFVIWTVLLLFLNGVYLEGRSRPNVVAKFSGTVALGLFIGVVFNLLFTGGSIARFDLTEGQIYTMSESSKKILRELPVPVKVNFYVTPSDKLPGELKNLERDVKDKLHEMSVASGGQLRYRVIHMEAANVIQDKIKDKKDDEEGEEKDKKKSLEERLIDKGVRPFSVRALRSDEATTKLIYSSIGVEFKEKEEEIIPRIMPQNLPELEYRLVSVAYKLARETPPIVVVVAPFEEMKIPPHMMRMYMQMGKQPPQQDDPYEMVVRLLQHEKFEVRRVKLEKGDSMPEDYDALVVIAPRELNERQKWEINRAIVSGTPTLIAAQNYKWQYQISRNAVSPNKVEEKPGVNEILQASGIRIDERILMDKNHETLTVSSGNPLERIFGGGLPVKLPVHIVVNASTMNQDVSITSRIGRLFYLWGSALKLNEEKLKENKLDVTTLVSSSDTAWLVPSGDGLTTQNIKPPAKTEQYPLAVLVKGQFADAFADKDRPPYPNKPPQPGMPPPPPQDDDEGPAPPITPKPGKMIVMGCGQMFNKSFLAGGNMDFFMNAVDSLTLSEDLIHIRAKKPVDRVIDKPSAGARVFWQVMVLAFMELVIVAGGITRLLLVRSARERYRAALRAKSAAKSA